MKGPLPRQVVFGSGRRNPSLVEAVFDFVEAIGPELGVVDTEHRHLRLEVGRTPRLALRI